MTLWPCWRIPARRRAVTGRGAKAKAPKINKAPYHRCPASTRTRRSPRATRGALRKRREREPGKTRAGLRAQEEALGIKEQLDEQYAALEQLMELVNKPPAEALKELEEKLKNNPAMQAEPERIAEAALKDAQQDLADAAQNQQQLAEALKQPLPEDPDPIPMAPKPEQLAQAAQAMAEEKIPQIEEANEAAGIEIQEPSKPPSSPSASRPTRQGPGRRTRRHGSVLESSRRKPRRSRSDGAGRSRRRRYRRSPSSRRPSRAQAEAAAQQAQAMAEAAENAEAIEQAAKQAEAEQFAQMAQAMAEQQIPKWKPKPRPAAEAAQPLEAPSRPRTSRPTRPASREGPATRTNRSTHG